MVGEMIILAHRDGCINGFWKNGSSRCTFKIKTVNWMDHDWILFNRISERSLEIPYKYNAGLFWEIQRRKFHQNHFKTRKAKSLIIFAFLPLFSMLEQQKPGYTVQTQIADTAYPRFQPIQLRQCHQYLDFDRGSAHCRFERFFT